MAKPQLAVEDFNHLKLKPNEFRFAMEYVKHYQHRAAAVMCGYDPDRGSTLIKQENIHAAVEMMRDQIWDNSLIDTQWLIEEAVDLIRVAKFEGKLSVVLQGLNFLGKTAPIDAFAAEKVHMVTDDEMVARLIRGRRREAKRNNSEVSFF